MDDPAALLLISHGSRQPHAAAFAAELAASLRRADPDRIVAVSFLELNRPSPADALRRLGRSGVKDVLAMPLLFSAGYHYRIDVPAAVDAALESQPQLRVRTAAPLLTNSDDEFIAALDARLSEALGDTSSEPVKRPDGLVLLTAGSSDHSARARSPSWPMPGVGPITGLPGSPSVISLPTRWALPSRRCGIGVRDGSPAAPCSWHPVDSSMLAGVLRREPARKPCPDRWV